jgi:glycosyltransferase involved in cell wall biosynthesis
MSCGSPDISVVVPSLNQARFLDDTLASLFAQTVGRVEVLLMDGGSTDGTDEVIRKYSDRLAFWRSHPDGGQAAAINEGMRRSTGDVLCWLNADDLHLPYTLQVVWDMLQGRTDHPALVHGSSIILREDMDPVACQVGGRPRQGPAGDLAAYDYIVQPSAFWTRALWDRAGELNVDYHYVLDWDWFLRAGEVCEFEYVDKALSIYRVHEGHKTGSGDPRRRKEILSLIKRYASPYWQDLYERVAASYDRLLLAKRIASRIPLGGSRRWLSLCALPVIGRYCRSRHIRMALATLK